MCPSSLFEFIYWFINITVKPAFHVLSVAVNHRVRYLFNCRDLGVNLFMFLQLVSESKFLRTLLTREFSLQSVDTCSMIQQVVLLDKFLVANAANELASLTARKKKATGIWELKKLSIFYETNCRLVTDYSDYLWVKICSFNDRFWANAQNDLASNMAGHIAALWER